MDIALHHRTPTLTTMDPRGLVVRAIAYARSEAGQDAEARITRSAFDAAGRAIAQWDPRFWGEGEAEGEYFGHVRPGAPNQTKAYSLSAAVLRTESVDAGWRIALAGDAGQPRLAWDGRGTHRRTEYDAQLRPVSVHEHLADEPSHCVERFTYGDSSEYVRNRCGRLLQHEDTAGLRHFPGSGVLGQSQGEVQRFLVSLESPDWEDAGQSLLEDESYATRWTHDALGAVLTQTDAVGNVQSSAFDTAGQVLRVSLTPSGEVKQALVSDIVYNALGQVEAQTAGNGVRSTARYSAVDARLIQLQAQRQADGHTLQDLFYAYDPMGNVERLEDLAQPTQWFGGQVIEPVSTYEYDTLYQLIKATGRESVVSDIGPALPNLGGPGGTADASRLRNYTQEYSYDAGGNLTTLIHRDNGGQVLQHRTMAVDEHSNRSLFWPEDTPRPDIGAGFDANGNQQRLEDQPLHWDGRNQLKRVVQVARDNVAKAAPEDDEQYVYGGGGLRLRKVRTTWTGSIRHSAEVRYLPGLELRRNSASGQVYAVASVRAGRAAVRHLYWSQGLPAGIDSGQYRYSLDDHLGSSALELDRLGQVISHEGYHPYGSTAWWSARASVEADYKTIRYSGKERDATGLYYYGFRYYAPWLQRWINPDPVGDIDGLNLFRFVRNRPVSAIDVNGLVSTPPRPEEENSQFTDAAGWGADSLDSVSSLYTQQSPRLPGSPRYSILATPASIVLGTPAPPSQVSFLGAFTSRAQTPSASASAPPSPAPSLTGWGNFVDSYLTAGVVPPPPSIDDPLRAGSSRHLLPIPPSWGGAPAANDAVSMPPPTQSGNAVCKVCGHNAKYPSLLKRHMAKHTEEKAFVCDEPGCTRAYVREGDMAVHRRSHSDVRPFICTTCGKSFLLKKLLTQHSLTHTRVKSYVCPECGKGFAQAGHLASHRPTHGDARNFVCVHCDASFKQPNSLSRHKQRCLNRRT